MDHIPGARWVIFEASSHMPHVEERELCMKTVNDFLAARYHKSRLQRQPASAAERPLAGDFHHFSP
jgi:hypothetical protein